MFEKKDELGRIIYRRENDVFRVIYRYYENTNNVKLKIEFVAGEQFYNIFDRNKKVVYNSEDGSKIIFNNVKVYNDRINIKLPLEVRDEYIDILRKSVNKFKNKKNESRTNGW